MSNSKKVSMIPVRPRSINTYVTGEQPKLFYNPQHPPPSNPRTATISPSDITVEQKRMESLDQYKSRWKPTGRARNYEIKKVFSDTDTNRKLGISGQPWTVGPGSQITVNELREEIQNRQQRPSRNLKWRRRTAWGLIMGTASVVLFLAIFLPIYLTQNTGSASPTAPSGIGDTTSGNHSTILPPSISISLSPSPSQTQQISYLFPTTTQTATVKITATPSSSSSGSSSATSSSSGSSSATSSSSESITISATGSESITSSVSAQASVSISRLASHSSSPSVSLVVSVPTTVSPSVSVSASQQPLSGTASENKQFFTINWPPTIFTYILLAVCLILLCCCMRAICSN